MYMYQRYIFKTFPDDQKILETTAIKNRLSLSWNRNETQLQNFPILCYMGSPQP